MMLQALDELNESASLRAQAFRDGRVGEVAVLVEKLVYLRQEDTPWIEKGIAVTKYHLQLLHRPQGAPHPGAKAHKTDWPLVETLRELQHIDEVFQDARNAAVVFGSHDDQSSRSEDAFGKTGKGNRLFAIGLGIEDFERQFRQIEDVEGRF